MKSSSREYYLLIFPALILFSGCFDTSFDFKTTVQPNGAISRQTKIEGRAANLFKVPDGPGWKANISEHKGGSAILPDIRYTVDAKGNFQPGQVISPDYQFSIEDHVKGWGEKEISRAALAGIQEPYKDHIFSKNLIKISRVKGFFSETFFYEETFQNAGIFSLLLIDIKEELRGQAQLRGETLQDAELDILANLRLEEDILPQFRFKSELQMPGKVLSTNGKKSSKSKAVWNFTLKDFQQDYSIYKIEATSRSLLMSGIIFWAVIGGLGFLFIVFAVVGVINIKRGKKGRKP